MKKLLLTTLITGALAGSVFAQGTVAFQATSAHGLIQYQLTPGGTTNSVATGNPATIGTYGDVNISVYAASAGTSDPLGVSSASATSLPAAWVEGVTTTPTLQNITPLAGWTASTTFTLDNVTAGGTAGEIMVVAWTGTATSWNAAIAAGGELFGWSGEYGLGLLDWSNATGNPLATPPTIPAGLTYGATGGFDGIIMGSIPEPTSFALAGIGLATLLILRRRK
jgi:hypothetical protein